MKIVFKGCTLNRITSWSFETVHGNWRVCQWDKRHAKLHVLSGNRTVFITSKPLPNLEIIGQLK